MTADHRGEQPQAGGTRVVQRLLRRFSAARSARGIVGGLITRPPASLAELERLVGRLDVDMAGPEGHGGGVFRPYSPFDPAGEANRVRRGDLRPGIEQAFVAFDYDLGWPVEASLDLAPREALALPTSGPSTVYDLCLHPGPIVGLFATVDEEDAP